jgi:aerobic carbon-monoxide dehydrogenase large subunit
MDGDLNIDQLAFSKFAVGQPVPRSEDPILLRGQGQYTDDLNLPGQAYAVMVRSGYAHGVINGIDTEAARQMPGVLGIYTGPDRRGHEEHAARYGNPNRRRYAAASPVLSCPDQR